MRRSAAPLVAVWLVACGPAPSPETVGVRFAGLSDNPAELSILVEGLDRSLLQRLADDPPSEAQWSALARVSTGSDDAPPLLGRWEVGARGLQFRPRFPVTTGLPHRVAVDLADLYTVAGLSPPTSAEDIDVVLTLPEPAAQATTRIVRIWPAVDRWPANTLRFYVEFSSPMGADPPGKYLKLLDGDGRALPLPFVEIPEGLWDGERRRLTVFFHPGRIKRGVAPGESLGPVLVAGRRYQIDIDRSWPDRNGQPLAGDFNFSFEAGSDDRTRPNPAAWKITTPPAGTREPLTVEFGEPLDPWLAERMIHVASVQQPVAGRADAGDGTRWRFVPGGHWEPGPYRLVVGPGLEDLAGNRPGEVFDRAVEEESRSSAEALSIEFEVRRRP